MSYKNSSSMVIASPALPDHYLVVFIILAVVVSAHTKRVYKSGGMSGASNVFYKRLAMDYSAMISWFHCSLSFSFTISDYCLSQVAWPENHSAVDLAGCVIELIRNIFGRFPWLALQHIQVLGAASFKTFSPRG